MLRNIALLKINHNPIKINKMNFFSCSNNYNNYDTHDKDKNGKLIFGGSSTSTKHLNHWNWPEMATYEVSYVTYAKVLELEKSLNNINKKLDDINETLERIDYKL